MKKIKFVLCLILLCIVIFIVFTNEGVSDFVSTIAGKFNTGSEDTASDESSSLLGKWNSENQKISVDFISDSTAKITFTDIMPLPISFDYTLEDSQTIRGVISDSVTSLAENYLSDDSALTQMINDDNSIYFSYTVNNDQLVMTEQNTGTVFSLKRTD